MQLCKIIAENPIDFDYLRSYVGNYPIKLLSSFDDDVDDGQQFTLIVGWYVVKKRFPNQNILDKKIDENKEWVFSKTEDMSFFNSSVEEFINKSVKNWLPEKFVLFDPLFEKLSILDFATHKLDLSKLSYLYFHKDVLYINNNNNNFVLNLKSFKLMYNNYKSIISNFLNNLKCMCLSYANIADYVDLDELGCIYTFESARWIKFGDEVSERYFQIIPGFDIKKYIPFIMSKVSAFKFSSDEKTAFKRLCEKDNITQWLSSRDINLSKDFTPRGVDIKNDGDNRLIKVAYSNKRTITGRIMANDSFNPQHLNKSNDDRSHIVSRFKGGKIVVFDYISFEARIALYFCGDQKFIDKFKYEDVHIHTAHIIFGNVVIDDKKRKFSKDINHRILYGSSKGAVIKELSFLQNPEEVYYNIRQFLNPLLLKFKEFMDLFERDGHIKNPWGTIIYPEKTYASYNNFIQSSAVEIMVDQLFKVKKFLQLYKSEFLFQVHDSLVFDICPEESSIVRDLAKILMCHNDMYFSISYSRGYDYKNLSTPIEIVQYKC